MKLTAFLIIALIISLLSYSASYDVISTDESYMKVDQVTMRFQGTDAVISISYGLDMFSSMYVLLLGAHNLEPAINGFFFDFDDIEIVSISKDRAVIFAKNVSRRNDEFYLYDSNELGGTARLITTVYPDGSTQTFLGASAIEATFYTE
ncbi:hypothetical protein [Methanolobus profundi]|uniref:Uncharacterized protein n=1 Tax=Methanolobus profundi TaxID=487685 RepID=A0A1I4S0Q4_9EURY|nr:hypothetical protein [Methanolobus profundi]SFM57860.1 hypothetical protein SAMN04488696_1690 [Methanolobus profundi]